MASSGSSDEFDNPNDSLMNRGKSRTSDTSNKPKSSKQLKHTTIIAIIAIAALLAAIIITIIEFTKPNNNNNPPNITTTPIKSKGCNKPIPNGITPGKSSSQWLIFNDPIINNTNRTYNVHLPTHYSPNKAYPMIVSFHCFYQNAFVEEEMDQLANKISDKYGVIIIYPNGVGDCPSGITGWNAAGTSAKYGTCDTNRTNWDLYECYDSCLISQGCDNTKQCTSSSCQDDTGFIEKMMEKLNDELCFDKQYIHAVGYSSGGIMAYQVGIALSNIFAGIAPHAGSPMYGYNNKPEYRVSLLDFHGFTDYVIPSNITQSYGFPDWNGIKDPKIKNGEATLSEDGMYYTPTPDVMKVWAERNGCQGKEEWKHYKTSFDGKRKLYCFKPYGDCQDGTDVIQCAGDWSHEFPATDCFHWNLQGNENCVNAYPEIIWQFVSTHPKKNVVWNP